MLTTTVLTTTMTAALSITSTATAKFTSTVIPGLPCTVTTTTDHGLRRR